MMSFLKDMILPVTASVLSVSAMHFFDGKVDSLILYGVILIMLKQQVKS